MKSTEDIKYINLHQNENWTFSTAVKAGRFVFLAHHVGTIDEKGNSLNTVEEQTKMTFKNMKTTLEAVGYSVSDLVKTTVYLKDINDFNEMREAYRQFFTEKYPARMTATTEFIHANILVMIDAIAYK